MDDEKQPDAGGCRLLALLQETLRRFHPEPSRVRPDAALMDILFGLYGDDRADVVWRDRLRPYIAAHGAALRNVFDEHAADLSWRLLDTPEVLMIFERAENDRERLRRAWPGATSDLLRISDVWGVPL